MSLEKFKILGHMPRMRTGNCSYLNSPNTYCPTLHTLSTYYTTYIYTVLIREPVSSMLSLAIADVTDQGSSSTYHGLLPQLLYV